MKKHEVYPKGFFGRKPLVSACVLAPEQLMPTHGYGGSVFAHHVLYGTFRTASGVIYSIMMRNVGLLGAADIYVYSNRNGGAQLEPVKEFFNAFSGLVFYGPTPGGIAINGMAIGPTRPSEPFAVVVTKDGSTWSEGSLLTLQGKFVGGCGLQWMTPLTDGVGGNHMQIYHMQRGSGTILGEPVEGFFDITAMYSPPGTTYFTTLGGQYQTWTSFGTEYDDGSMEVGQVCASDGLWSFAVIANQDGPLVLSTDVTARSSFDKEGYAARTVYVIDGEEWEWIAAERAGLDRGGVLGASPLKQVEGHLRRRGEKRAIVTALGNNAANINMPRL